MTGAGFWRRYAAWSLDAALLAVPSLLLCWPLLRRAAAALARDYPAVLELARHGLGQALRRSEEHTSELQSLMRISYAVFCLKKKKNNEQPTDNTVPTSHMSGQTYTE